MLLTVHMKKCFRPLAGINCNHVAVQPRIHGNGFRPLAGINCNIHKGGGEYVRQRFPSPCGDKLQSAVVQLFGDIAVFPSPYGV